MTVQPPATRRAPRVVRRGAGSPSPSTAPDAAAEAPVHPRASLLPVVGTAVLLLLLILALSLCARLRTTLLDELSGRLRVSVELVTDALTKREAAPLDSDMITRLDEIRRATLVSDIFLYDLDGVLLGGSTAQAAVTGIPRQLRLGGAAPADPGRRRPEHDASGGLSLVVPLAPESGVGAVLARIDASGQRGLAGIDLLFQVAKALAGIVVAAGVLILLRWVSTGGPGPIVGAAPSPAPAISDVDVVLGRMQEVVSTLKVNESQARDRMTAAEADAEHHRKTNDLILESITSAIVAFDSRGRVTMFNRAAERILDVSGGAASGRPVEDVFGSDSRITRLAQDVLETDRTSSRVEIGYPTGDGETTWLGASSSVIRRRDGAPVGGILLLTDLTETKRLRDQMSLKDRLSAVGEMSAGIAHEIKNSLHSLMGLTNLLREDFDEPPLAVKGILAEVTSLEAIVKGVLEFSRPRHLVRTAAPINDLVYATRDAVVARARQTNVHVVLDLDDDLPSAWLDRDAMKRVFLNLALNAVEAMGESGTLTISTRLGDVPGKRDAVRIGFRDTGPGIPESERSRIFTPFYSTKSEGNGLGLAISHRTVMDHGGRIHLLSREGVGCEFVLHLPGEE